MFNKLQTRLIGAFLLVIFSIFVITIFISITQRDLLNRYNTITTTQSRTYEISTLTDNLITNYSKRIRETNDSTLQTEYMSINQDITSHLRDIESTLINEESHSAFVRLERLVSSMQDDYTNGVKAATEGDLITAFSVYDELTRKNFYVNDNTAGLIFTELEATQDVHAEIVTASQRNYFLGIGLGSIVFIVSVIFSYTFSRRIARPLSMLNTLTKEIGRGNFDFHINPSLLKKEDEIGSLANSFNQMKLKVGESLTKLQTSNKKLLQAQKELEQSNRELKRINKVMTGREMKMIELKDKISELEDQLDKPQ